MPNALAVTRRALFWLLCLGVALVSWRFIALGVEASMDFVAYHAQVRPVAFFAHVTLAPVALALMPLQFWQGLRARRPGLHRWIGRSYGVSVLLAGLGGLAMALTTTAGPVASAGFALLALAWLGVTARAVQLAMARRIAEHRRWMMRSASLTFAAVTLRIYLPVLAPLIGFETAYPLIAWACWVPNLMVAEWLLRRGAAPARRMQAA